MSMVSHVVDACFLHVLAVQCWLQPLRKFFTHPRVSVRLRANDRICESMSCCGSLHGSCAHTATVRGRMLQGHIGDSKVDGCDRHDRVLPRGLDQVACPSCCATGWRSRLLSWSSEGSLERHKVQLFEPVLSLVYLTRYSELSGKLHSILRCLKSRCSEIGAAAYACNLMVLLLLLGLCLFVTRLMALCSPSNC